MFILEPSENIGPSESMKEFAHICLLEQEMFILEPSENVGPSENIKKSLHTSASWSRKWGQSQAWWVGRFKALSIN